MLIIMFLFHSKVEMAGKNEFGLIFIMINGFQEKYLRKPAFDVTWIF
jgi:hypothetical protein